MRNSKQYSESFGLKLFIIGFLIMAFGFAIGLTDFESVANVTMYLGLVLGIIGMIIHLKVVLSKLRRK